MRWGRKSSSICQCPMAICPSSFASSSCIVVAAALDVSEGGNHPPPLPEGVQEAAVGQVALVGPVQVIVSFPPGCWRRVGGLHPQLTPDDGVVVAVVVERQGAEGGQVGHDCDRGGNTRKSLTHGRGSQQSCPLLCLWQTWWFCYPARACLFEFPATGK